MGTTPKEALQELAKWLDGKTREEILEQEQRAKNGIGEGSAREVCPPPYGIRLAPTQH
jgi:hypothetical protein